MYYIKNGKMYYIDDELYHGYKYIKREWKNGRWVYTYDDGELKKAENDMVRSNFEAAKAKIDYNDKANIAFNAVNSKGYRKIHSMSGDDVAASVKAEQDARERLAETARVAKAYTEKYYKMESSTLVQRTTAKAVVAVANFVSSTISKLASLFSKTNKRPTDKTSASKNRNRR